MAEQGGYAEAVAVAAARAIVLAFGASGGVGDAAVQLAHAMGARVLATVVRPGL